MSGILVATDLSPRADRAVARAFRLAAEHGVKLTILSVVDGDYPEAMAASLAGQTKEHLTSFCTSQALAEDVDWTARVVEGDPWTDIHAAAERAGADLLVLGLHRERALFDTLRETTLERLVRASPRPVLLAAEPADHDYERAVAAVDASPAATAALTAARRWAPTAQIFPFHAVYTGLGGTRARDADNVMGESLMRETRHALKVWAASGGVPEGVPEPHVFDGGLGTVFAAQVLAHSAQLVVLGANARHGLAHRVLGGFAREIVRDPPCDLLVARGA